MNSVNGKIYELLQTVVKDLDFTITVHNPNKKGAGFFSELSFVNLKDKNSDKEFEFVVKSALNGNQNGHFPLRPFFMNEINFFDIIWPKLQQFESGFVEEPFDKIVKCLATTSGVNSEILVLENLKYSGFDVFDKRKPFDRHHMELILRLYGNFHALSLAFRALHPDEYSNLSNKLTDLHIGFHDDKRSSDARTKYEFYMKSLQPGKDDKVIEVFQRYVDSSAEQLMDSISYHGKHSVILHGDCWSNNLLFKYNERRELLDLRFIDFQLSKDGNPVTDISYVVYSGGNKEIFDDLNHYLEVYHESLAATLTAFGCNAEEIYSLQELKDDWKKHCRFGFAMGLILWKGKLTYEDDAVDFTDVDTDQSLTEKFYAAPYDEETYREITRDLIVHMYENDFL